MTDSTTYLTSAAEERAAALTALDAVDRAAANPDREAAARELPHGYHMVIAVRDGDRPCPDCDGDDAEHKLQEIVLLTSLDAEATLGALSAAMQRVGRQAGIGVGIIDPSQLVAAMGAAMGVPRPASDDDGPAPNTGQYL